MSSLDDALRTFEKVKANVAKAKKVWGQIEEMTPRHLEMFDGNPPEYDALVDSYKMILESLPKISGWKPEAIPWDLNDMAAVRMDAMELGMIDAKMSVEEDIYLPGRELANYERMVERKWRELIRREVQAWGKLIQEHADAIWKRYPETTDGSTKVSDCSEWEEVERAVGQLEVLLGDSIERPKEWVDFRRHLRFGQYVDLRDIRNTDWPTIQAYLNEKLYFENEPIPVEVEDLDQIVDSKPRGNVVTALNWKNLSPNDFERLVFSLLDRTASYVQVDWSMHTNAPDRGRDIACYRKFEDELEGEIRHRIIVQCKHYANKSVNVGDISKVKEQLILWEPPKVDILIFATSGRFSQDAVQWIERNNASGTTPRIEMWPESKLEAYLARHPGISVEFGLR